MIFKRRLLDPQRVYVFVDRPRHPVVLGLTVGSFLAGLATLLNPETQPRSIEGLDPWTQRAWAGLLVGGAALLILAALFESRNPRRTTIMTVTGSTMFGFGCLTLGVLNLAAKEPSGIGIAWGIGLGVAYLWWAGEILWHEWRSSYVRPSDS